MTDSDHPKQPLIVDSEEFINLYQAQPWPTGWTFQTRIFFQNASPRVEHARECWRKLLSDHDCTFNNFIISPGEHPPKDSHQHFFSGLRGGWEASSRRPGRDGPSDSKGGRLRCDLGVMFVLRIHHSHSLICLFGVRGFSTLLSSKRYDVYWFLVILHNNQLRFMTPQTKLFEDLSSPIFLVFFFTNAGVRWYNTQWERAPHFKYKTNIQSKQEQMGSLVGCSIVYSVLSSFGIFLELWPGHVWGDGWLNKKLPEPGAIPGLWWALNALAMQRIVADAVRRGWWHRSFRLPVDCRTM